MRPPGEVRQALLAALARGGPGDFEALAARSQVGLAVAQETLRQMARAGAIKRLDRKAGPKRGRPRVEYALPGSQGSAATPPGLALAQQWAPGMPAPVQGVSDGR